ncbi:MAG: T9SS C-terminal target domain-containing protein [Winogradskyella sp.]|uniref:thrombospondin type 3 repeat-containing protein n=1 Tax=Winogradskyella sp. TaxID=1883156 RepID=UPI000F3EAA8F|nr:thrombospondin type 3 repeat-containing protein [Winogradskyella sp.]RNC88208.1 MAG: T9SS C-terminal target domain-containing protein [Winogradskyella sp.]
MKKKLLVGSSILFGLIAICVFLIQNQENQSKKLTNDDIVEIHKENLSNSPFKESLKLTKKERKALGIPPDRYYEEEFELTMNPILGRPTPENLEGIRGTIEDAFRQRVPGDGTEPDWESRGPDNVGGRTRGLMFDPNDTSNETVFAGGVSGGLWKNTNISNANSTWTRVDVPDNLNVSVIVADPNNPSIFYLGTGESYTNGDVSGDGVWQSTDAGNTWARVLGGVSGPTTFESASNITVNSPSNIAGDYNSVETTSFGSTVTSIISADFVLANDTSSVNPREGCTSFGDDATGKIAIIQRGSCNFTTKVRNAQDAGAIAAIVYNNVGTSPINMGGTDASITIPAVMISKADGDAIVAAMQSGTVNGSINPATGTFTGTLVPGIQQINDIKIKDNSGTTEVYVAAGDAFYGSANTTTFLGGTELGIFKSVDDGATWNKLNVPLTANGNEHEPNDIEVGADGTIWMSSIDSSIFGDGGGEIFSSTDGENFTNVRTIPNADRTQIAVSSQDPGVIYVLAEIPGGVAMEGTTDGFNSDIFDLELPNDVDNGIPENDFTRGQAFYDLLLEVDPNNDQIVYAGGIDLFKSTNGAQLPGPTEPTSWAQISKWSNNNNLANLNVPLVHADQHTMIFDPSNPNSFIVGNDGGVYYGTLGGLDIQSRNNGFITSQFYTVGVAPTDAFAGDTDFFLGGLQDNGTQLFTDANPGINSSAEAFGGDGAYSFFDQDGTDQYYITNFVFNRIVRLVDLGTGQVVTINSETGNNGSFINPQELDSNLDILYSNYSSGGNVIIRRYSGITSTATLAANDFGAPEFDSRPTALKISPFTTTSSTLYVGTFLGDIFRVDNANVTPNFVNIETNNEIVGSISDIELGASENEIFVTVHNYGVNNVWYTPDGGTTWLAKDGDLPDLPVKAILQNPLNPEEVIIGTELGIWFTENFSSSSPDWEPAQGGMSTVRITDIDLRNDNSIYISTYGRGVFSGQFIDDPDADNDGDGVPNISDNCPNTANADQADSDGDGVGDVCQDTDSDGILDINDNCPNTANADQTDTDGDGVGDVCQDSDGDSVADGEDNCPDTPNPDQQDLNNNGIGDVCDFSFEEPSNITLEIISERCEGQNNGQAIIRVVETFVNYTVTINGNGLNATQTISGVENTTLFTDLDVGSYTVCVAVDGRDFEQCFEINIEAAPSLGGVFSVVNDESTSTSETSVAINTGTAPYTVVFNDEVIMVTSQTNFNIDTSGGGLLEVSSSVECEGKISRVIEDTLSIALTYGPNPVTDNLQINIPNLPENGVNVQVFDIHGRLVINQNMLSVNGSFINVPFTNLTQGTYFVRLDIENVEIIKIVKR